MKLALMMCVAVVALLPAVSHGSVEITPKDDAWHGLRALQRKGKGKPSPTKGGPQCGIPVNKCQEKNGRCMPKEECVRLLGNRAGWVQGGQDLCKSRKPSDECGCCYKRSEKDEETKSTAPEETVPSDVELVPQGIAMAMESESGGARVEFVWTEDGIKDVKVVNLQGWSFNAHADSTTKVECDEKSCSAAARGDAFHPRLDEVFAPIPVEEPEGSHGRLLQEKHHAHIFTSEMVPSEVKLVFPNYLTSELLETLHKDPSKPFEFQGACDLIFATAPTGEQMKFIEPQVIKAVQWPFRVRWRLVVIDTVIKFFPPWWLTELNKNLCIQPVRTRYRACLFEMFGICFVRSPTYTYSGDGLAFGRPLADELWGKVDITFTWRDWITVDDTTGKYQSLTEGAEMTDLRNEVSEDDCVEVFFVKKFSPSSTYGGGACWSSGTVNAKIISSDEQVACGVDKTHLAHEIAHAMGLMHPGTSHATLPDGSTGTLACPSGWQRDNPRRNSRDNGNNVVNPLLISYFASWDIDNAECNSSADCGSCSAHIPSDSC